MSPMSTHGMMLHRVWPSVVVIASVDGKKSDSHLVCACVCLVADMTIHTADTEKAPTMTRKCRVV